MSRPALGASRMRSASAQRQGGVALIMAILLVALATILAVSVATDGYMDQRRTAINFAMDEAYQMGLGAEALAADTLQSDNAQQDSLNEAWATPVTLAVADGAGEIKGSLEDLQGRFNLNNVLNPDGSRNDDGVRQLQRLLELLGMETKWATILVDWVDADTEQQTPDGAEDIVYTAQTPVPYLAPNMPITRVSELLALPGFGLANYRKLEPYVAALPIDSKLNVCTAPAVVLDSLASSTTQYTNNLDTLTTNRAAGCFPNIADVRTSFSADPGFARLMQENPDYLAEKSSYFRANMLVTIGTTELALYSVLNRTGNNDNIRIRVIQRSFGTS